MGKIIRMISDKERESSTNIRNLMALVDKANLPPQQKKELIQKIKAEQKMKKDIAYYNSLTQKLNSLSSEFARERYRRLSLSIPKKGSALDKWIADLYKKPYCFSNI